MPEALPAVEDNAGVELAPPTYVFVPLVLGLVLEFFVRTSFVPAPWRWPAGGVLVAAGVALNVGGFVTQKRAGTDPLPMHPSTRIVTHGPYRFTRNPMYVGFVLTALGIAVLADSLWPLLFLVPGLWLMHPHVIFREERYLERKFGDEYVAYKRRVRRWL